MTLQMIAHTLSMPEASVPGNTTNEAGDNEAGDGAQQGAWAPCQASEQGDMHPTAQVGMVRILPWVDPLVERLGHDPRSRYVERFWLPVLGPATTWLLRLGAYGFEDSPEGFELGYALAAAQLGISPGAGRHGMLRRAISRARRFGLARDGGPGTLELRRMIPPLPQRHEERLPAELRRAHALWISAMGREQISGMGSDRFAGNVQVRERAFTWPAYRPGEVPGAAEMRSKRPRSLAEQRSWFHSLALTLAGMGEERSAMESQLLAWGCHPALAGESARLALARTSASPEVVVGDVPVGGEAGAGDDRGGGEPAAGQDPLSSIM